MSNDPHSTVVEKVRLIFEELAGDRVERLDGSRFATEAINRMSMALSTDHDPKTADEIAFHIGDWNDDAAFILCMHLYPERFTDEEIRAGIRMMLCHAPNHLAAAAKLAGDPIRDVFDLGPLVADA